MCHSSVLMLWVGTAIVIALLSWLVKRWTGVAAFARMGHALSLALIVGGVVIRAMQEPVDCYSLCILVNLGLYSWWWALAVGCYCR